MNTKCCLDIKIGERTFQFILDSDCPLGQALDAAIEFWSHISKLNTEAIERIKNEKSEE